MERPVIFGHRGGASFAAENTIAAFRSAEHRGADGIELDVRLSRDGELVVIHDADVARTTGGNGVVAELDSAQLRALDAGGGERLPLLHEVYESIGISIQIEIKDPRAIEQTAKLLVARPDWGRRTIVSSFHPQVLVEATRLCPEVRRGLISHGLDARAISTAAGVDSQWLFTGWPGVSPETLIDARAAGLEPVVWLVNEREQWVRAGELEVSGVSSDVPELLAEWKNDE